MASKIVCLSMSRYNGGVKAKRQYGSSTITIFRVFFEDDHAAAREYRVGGRTPSERKAEAVRRFKTEMCGDVHKA